MEERSIDKLAGAILKLFTLCVILLLCWCFRNVLIYIILAAVLAFVGRPLYLKLRSLSVKKIHMPDALAAALTIVLILGFAIGLVGMLLPVVSGVVSDISRANIENMAQGIAVPLANFNQTLIENFPTLDQDFKIETFLYEHLMNMFDIGSLSSILGSAASIIVSLAVGIFAMVFIAFFFIRKPHIFTSIIIALVPDKYEEKVNESIGEIGVLISRYLIGLITEVLGVSLINFLGLFFIAKMGFRYSIGIAMMTGLFNILPYVGPLLGGALGLVLSLIIKYACATSFGIAVTFPAFVAIIIGIFVFTQLVDNYVFQPFIYSNSIRAHPLEIFIVLLAVGSVTGMLGMLVAIPSYTVCRVIAVKFFGNVKAIRMLMGNQSDN